MLLDLSFNPWIVDENALERVKWSKWTRLKTFGLRECGLGEEARASLANAVGRGRCEDVEIVF